jgi:O-antigen/teichoic acid export membrane protein
VRAHLPLLFSFCEKYTQLLVNTASTVVLARLLTPAEVGVYAIGAVLAGLVQVLRDFGVGAYVIQEKQLTTQKLRAALTVSILLAWTLAALVLAGSGPAARFYQAPQVQTVLQILSITFLLIPFSAVVLPALRRQMRFFAIFMISTCQCATQMACAIILAVLGWGALSLAWGAVAGAVATLLVTLLYRPRDMPWLPGWCGAREIITFGSLATAGTLIDEAGVAAPDLIIGKMSGMVEVGLYGKAMGVINVFNQLVTAAVSPVIFPLFSAQARLGRDLRQAYLITASYMSALAWPFFGVVAVIAPALVQVLYGQQWLAAVPLIRIICLGSALYSMFSLARYLFVAMGQVKAQARLDALAVAVRVVAVLGAAPHGLHWIGGAVVLGAVFRSGLTFWYLRRLAGLRLLALLTATWRSALVTVVCVTGALLVSMWHAADHPGLQLLLVMVTGFLLWLAALHCVRHELAAEARKAVVSLQR